MRSAPRVPRGGGCSHSQSSRDHNMQAITHAHAESLACCNRFSIAFVSARRQTTSDCRLWANSGTLQDLNDVSALILQNWHHCRATGPVDWPVNVDRGPVNRGQPVDHGQRVNSVQVVQKVVPCWRMTGHATCAACHTNVLLRSSGSAHSAEGR